MHRLARVLVLGILVASSTVPGAPVTTDPASKPAAPAPSPAASTLPPPPAPPYEETVRAPAGTTVLPQPLMKQQGDFRLREVLKNVPGVGGAGR